MIEICKNINRCTIVVDKYKIGLCRIKRAYTSKPYWLIDGRHHGVYGLNANISYTRSQDMINYVLETIGRHCTKVSRRLQCKQQN